MSAPIRVAHLVGSTGLYGAERWILALLRHLPRDTVQSILVNLVDEPGQTSHVVRAATERGFPAIDLYTGGRFNPASISRLAGFVEEHGYHILHSHGYKADFLALFTAKKTGAKVISTPHGWSKEPDRRLALYEALDRFLLRFVDRVCPLSPDLHDGLRRSGVPAHKLRMLLNAVDIAEVDSIVPAAARRAGETVVGYVGQLIRRKNVECLISAFERLAADRDELRLTIVGDGPLYEELQRRVMGGGVGGRVRFTGYQPDRISVLKTFDVFVLPSLEEGIPRSLMEAMAAGVPIIASDIPGNRVLIHHGDTGLLFLPDDPDGLVTAIVTMIDQPALAKEMAQRARVDIEQHFSAERMAQDYTALYAECSTSSS